MPDVRLKKIISGGQTGVDQEALDFAIEVGLDHGGWCPQGRWCEEGEIPRRFRLTETESRDYVARTWRNVQNSDGTLIICSRPRLSRGTDMTLRAASSLRKPCLVITSLEPALQGDFLTPEVSDPCYRLTDFLRMHLISTLNIAGPRLSVHPESAQLAREFLRKWWERIRSAQSKSKSKTNQTRAQPGFSPEAPQ